MKDVFIKSINIARLNTAYFQYFYQHFDDTGLESLILTSHCISEKVSSVAVTLLQGTDNVSVKV